MPAGSVFSDAAPFTENFIFYDNRVDLEEKLRAVAQRYDPVQFSSRFRELQRQLAHGNTDELERALHYEYDIGPSRN